VEILRDLLTSAKLLTKTSNELEQMLLNLDLVAAVQNKQAEGKRDIDEGSSFLFQSDLIKARQDVRVATFLKPLIRERGKRLDHDFHILFPFFLVFFSLRQSRKQFMFVS
jgi:hypothetical protein